MTQTNYTKFRARFIEALDPEFYTIEHLEAMLLNGDAIALYSENAAIVFGIMSYPGGARAVHGIIAAGELPEIVSELIPQAEAFGKANGCQYAEIESRSGWSRILPSYEPAQILLRKAL